VCPLEGRLVVGVRRALDRVDERGRVAEVVVRKRAAGDGANRARVAACDERLAKLLCGRRGAGDDERPPTVDGAADLLGDPVDRARAEG
jgi:hypothetical protein